MKEEDINETNYSMALGKVEFLSLLGSESGMEVAVSKRSKLSSSNKLHSKNYYISDFADEKKNQQKSTENRE